MQQKKFSELLGNVITHYQNRSIETAQVMEEQVEMAKKFREAASRGEALGLTDDEVRFYDALTNNESAVKELTDETLKKIAHELTENLRKNLSVDCSERESVRASLRLMVKRILRKYRYPPDMQDAAIKLALQQAQALGESWADFQPPIWAVRAAERATHPIKVFSSDPSRVTVARSPVDSAEMSGSQPWPTRPSRS